MRPTTGVLIGLLLLLPAAFSADLTRYLAPGESITAQDTFVVDSVAYTLVYIDDEPVFLLDGSGEIITDPDVVGRVVNAYFTELYYPTDAEIAALRADFEAYDDSRNNGDNYPGVKVNLPWLDEEVGYEEEVCRMGLFLHQFPCTNDTDCFTTALFLCDEMGDAIGCSNINDVLPDVKAFSFASNDLEDKMDATFRLMDQMDSRNIRSNLNEIEGLIPGMKEDEEKLEETIFRMPRPGERCSTCLGVCPYIMINGEHLDNASAKIDAMLEKTGMLGDYEALGATMAAVENTRIQMASDNAARAYYHGIYDTLRERGQATAADARALLMVVANSSVSADANRIDALIAKIDADLEAGNFSQVNASIDELGAKTNRLAGGMPGQWEIYNSAEDAKAEASLSVFILETSNLNDEQAALASILSAKKNNLDRSFVAGLSPERYLELREDYINITETAEPVVQSVSSGSVYLSPLRAAARSTNEGVESLVVAVQPMSREEKGNLSEFAPIMLSALSFFSLGSLLTFAFLFLFARSAKANRVMMFMGFIFLGLGLLVAGALSAGAYFTLKGSSTDADFSEYRASLADSSHVSILVETEGVSSGAALEMKACAQKMAAKLSPRQVDIYDKTDGDCITSQNTTLGECYNSIEEPIITLRYSALQTRPEFSVVFVDNAVFTGDEEYFRECEVAQMLAVPVEAAPAESGGESNETMDE
ncbi:MAG: hypothetical protein PHY95_03860 [Candidatus ainarchaeum sp.]|nr:hypothetical protein [Candidatus ainarchaeum sp.]